MQAQEQLAVDAKDELDRLIAAFFRCVSFKAGEMPAYTALYHLFIDCGLLIRNSLASPEIASVEQFIEARQKTLDSGALTAFNEVETAEITEIFGNVAHRFSTYAKSGTMQGVPFEARGMISIQFIMTPDGWKISAMAWDDERPGLVIPDRYSPMTRRYS